MKHRLILISILLLATVLRFWKLGDYPALNADEAAIGYNAYSLIQTGRDEHGNPWPIHFKSFNDYKPGLYFYLVLPFIRFWGLNEGAVRIPGAFLGIATVYVVYLLVLQLFKNRNQLIGLIASFFLAISPWHIHFSRGGWEVNVATFFITLGVWLFLKSLKRQKYLAFSFLSFILSLYTYHAARIVVPLLVLGLLVIYREDFGKNIKRYMATGVFGLILLTPLIFDLFGPAGLSRAAGVGLFADPGPLARINEQRGAHKDFRSFPAIVLHNKVVNYGLIFLDNWAKHFHGEFLFLSGDVIQRNKVPETGQMYMSDVLWLLVGVWWLVRNIRFKSTQLILLWLMVAPTAAALTFQSPHALRGQNMVIPLTIISAVGLVKILTILTELKSRGAILNQPPRLNYTYTSGVLVIYLFILWNFLRYQHMYWVHMAKEYPFSSQYGLKELVSYLQKNQDSYQKIIVTDRYDQPYILFLFYLKYPPQEFQKGHVLTPRDKYGFSTVRNFDRFEFRAIDWDVDQPNNPNSLIIGTNEEIPQEANIVKEIYGSNGYRYFYVVAN